MSQLGVMAKYWQPGSVKTRLATSIGDVAAAAIYHQFLTTTLSRFDGIARNQVLAFAPAQHQADFAALHPNWNCHPQGEGDLGQRMRRYFQTAISSSRIDSVLLIGSDSPNLPQARVREALESLTENEVVLGPTGDGGYYLVGMNINRPEIFSNIEWSTPHVWAQTLKVLEDRHIRWHELPPWYDVDDQTDLTRLLCDLRESAESGDIALHRAITEILATNSQE